MDWVSLGLTSPVELLTTIKRIDNMKPLERYDIDECGCEYPMADGYWVIGEDVKKLEEQHELMLRAFRALLRDMDNVDRVCDLIGIHRFTGMRSVIQSFVNEGENQ